MPQHDVDFVQASWRYKKMGIGRDFKSCWQHACKAVMKECVPSLLPVQAQFGPMTETRSATVARATVNAARRGYRNVMLPSWYFSFLVYVLFIPEVVYSCLTLLLVVKWVTAQTRTIVHHLREASLVLLNQSKAKGDMSTGTPSIAPPFLQFEPKDLTAPLQAAKDYL